MRGEIAPEIAAGRLLHVGNFLKQRIAVGHHALIIVSAFRAAVSMRPGFLEIVGADGGVGPDVAFAGDFARIVEIIEHAELQR